MKWSVYNAFGGLAWLTGLLLAKNESFASSAPYFSADHHIVTGFSIAAMGLVVLLWTNLSTSG